MTYTGLKAIVLEIEFTIQQVSDLEGHQTQALGQAITQTGIHHREILAFGGQRCKRRQIQILNFLIDIRHAKPGKEPGRIEILHAQGHGQGTQLVGRAHAHIYREEPLRWRWLLDFYRQTFPQLYRALLPYTILAFGLFIIPAVLAFFVVVRNPDAIYVLEGPGIETLVRKVEQGKLWTEIAPSVRSAASSVILTNNIQVTFFTFAGGITAGLLSAWIVISNGLSIGAIFGLLQAHHLSAGLAEFVVAHGFIELSVVFVAGGCGLYLGDGLLRPGLQSRRAALIERGQFGVRVILGCAPLLIVAGLIEGFISPSGLPWLIKLLVGLVTGGVLYYYWLRVGCQPIQRPDRGTD